jgi:hypothetical protein
MRGSWCPADHRADARRTCATLLVVMNVHPWIVMQILRHAQFDVTMEVYGSASSEATLEALKRLRRASMAKTRCCTSQLYGLIRAQKHKRSPTAWTPDLVFQIVGVAGRYSNRPDAM